MSLKHQSPWNPPKPFLSGIDLYYGLSKSQGLVGPEGLGKLEIAVQILIWK
jgi:hypothetical protein